jgi:molybdenum cofactor guanylyltransferase
VAWQHGRMNGGHPPALPRAIGLVLAGGRSTRFGADKLAAELGGAPLLHHALRAVAGATTEVLLALAPDVPTPGLPELAVPLRVVRDRSADVGPLAGFAAALEVLPPTPGAEAIILVCVAADSPELGGALLGGLIMALGAADAVVLAEGGAWRPLPCVVRAAAAAPLVRDYLAGADRSIRALLGALRPVIVSEHVWRVWDPDGAWRRDVDQPSDLAAARQRREAI